MSLSKIIVVIVIAISGYQAYQYFSAGSLSDFNTIASGCSARQAKVKNISFEKLFKSQRDFQSLAELGCYTVVELSLDTCSLCKKLEAKFGAFMNKRSDVAIRIVRFSNPMINGMANEKIFGSKTISRRIIKPEEDRDAINAEISNKIEAFDKSIKAYGVGCGTPYIKIYGSDTEVISEDICRNRSGLTLLKQWMSSTI